MIDRMTRRALRRYLTELHNILTDPQLNDATARYDAKLKLGMLFPLTSLPPQRTTPPPPPARSLPVLHGYMRLSGGSAQVDVPLETYNKVTDELRSGRKISAIKLLKSYAPTLGLKDAKDIVEQDAMLRTIFFYHTA